MELPFDDADVTPLRADDPRPQRVTQYPTGARPPQRRTNARNVSTEVFRLGRDDRELAPRYDKELSNPGFTPGFLYVERGPGQGQLMPVNQGLMILGRSSSADLRLQHPSISRKHAQLTRKGERYFLKDCQSQNGTFVNKQRLTSEVELFAGDQLTLGTAFLRLRGANGTGEVSLATQNSEQSETPPATTMFQPGVAKIAIFACAAGFGLAGVLMLALMRLEGGKSETPAIAEVSAPHLNTVEGPKPSAAEPSRASAPTSLEPTPAPAQAAAAPVPAAVVPALPAVATTRHPSRKEKKKAAAVVRADPEPAQKTVAASSPEVTADADIKARYEQGNIGGALELAKKSHSDLAPRLAKFKTSYDQVQKAMAGKDTAAARSSVKLALAADEGISSGWGSYNAELKRDLVSLNQTETGKAPVKKKAAVEEAFSDADPAPAKPAAKATSTHKAAIDDAWGDDSAKAAPPAKTAVPQKKKASAAIDAAFGD